MTQLEDDILLNNLLKFPGTIIIYNNDLNTYNYVLNGHNSIPVATSASTTLPEGAIDLNGAVSINVETIPSIEEEPLESSTPISHNEEDISASEGSSIANESVANTSGISGTLEDCDPEDGMEAEDDSESELTNLSWLTELKNITNLTPSDVPLTDLPTARFNKFIAQVRRSRESYDKRKDQYTSLANAAEKPPFNYAQIIAMAMLDEGRMTLKQICKWIQEKFAYYKVHKNWNNSIRHNLSLSFYFTKVSRAKDEKGKGGYWELSMDVSKSERKRIRIRQRKRNGTTAPSIRSRNRQSASATSQSFASESKVATEQEETEKVVDGNNNDNNDNTQIEDHDPFMSEEQTADDEQEEQNIIIEGSESANICLNDTHADSQVLPTNKRQPTIEIIDNQLIKSAVLVDNCSINFDSIISAENGDNIFTNLTVDEIFSGNEIPQPANDDIVVPFFGTSGIQTVQTGPNVIVETIPYFLPEMENFDEQDFGNLININEQEISDEFLNEHGFL
ncbi:forkhead box protein N2 [Uranotaenia lowii]|uniref:forkhead box protein N2 n=1 Tax=Uranotaenia lowii TaxID=190385 RepID=UPI002479AB37|nr:forkhead box protein N2 [Uranotaenia lowii]